jgi:hypothetical protein
MPCCQPDWQPVYFAFFPENSFRDYIPRISRPSLGPLFSAFARGQALEVVATSLPTEKAILTTARPVPLVRVLVLLHEW